MSIEELYQLYLQNPSVQTDTRKLKSGDLFFALKGPSFNGNQFAAQALKDGAAYAIVDDAAFVTNDKTILVKDGLEALQQLALHHRKQLNIPFLAVTGSNGKTTTKELIHAVLSSTYKTYTTEGNLNNHIGVPLTILKIKADAEIAIIEMGANHLREIASYCTICLPTHGLISNCGKAHLEGFGSEEGVRKGKGELFDFLRQNGGTAFIMADYDYLEQMSEGIATRIRYGTENGEVVGTAVASDPFLEVDMSKGINGRVHTNLVGAYNLPNVLAAVTVGLHFNVTPQRIKSSIENYQPSNSRSQLISKGSNTIILDAYNANPTSMKVAIDNFAKVKGDNKILVLGAMAELGNTSVEEHEQILHEIKKHGWQQVILVGGDFAKLEHPFQYKATAKEAGEWLQQQKVNNAQLLVKGSRSTAMEKVLEYL